MENYLLVGMLALQVTALCVILLGWIRAEMARRLSNREVFHPSINDPGTEHQPLLSTNESSGSPPISITIVSIAGTLLTALSVAVQVVAIGSGDTFDRPRVACRQGFLWYRKTQYCPEEWFSWAHGATLGITMVAPLATWVAAIHPYRRRYDCVIDAGSADEGALLYYSNVVSFALIILVETARLLMTVALDEAFYFSDESDNSLNVTTFILHSLVAACGFGALGELLDWRWLFMLPAMDVMSLCRTPADQGDKLTRTTIGLPYDLSIQLSEQRMLRSKTSWIVGSLAGTLWKEWRGSLIMLGVVRLFQEALGLLPALLLRDLVDTLNEEEVIITGMVKRKEVAIVILIATCSLVSSVLRGHYDLKFSKIGIYSRGLLSSAVYRQAVLLSTSEREAVLDESGANGSTITNHLLVDVPRVCDQMSNLHNLWCLPLQVGLALYLLSLQIGLGFVAGLVIVITMIPLNALLAKKIQKINASLLSANDNRIAAVTTVLQNIKFIKMCGWSALVKSWISKPRREEMKSLAWVKYLDAACCFFWATTPVLVSLVSFATYTGIFDGVLTPGKVVASLSLFNTLILPLNSYPWVLNGAVEAYVSLIRLDKFMRTFVPQELITPPTPSEAPTIPECTVRRSNKRTEDAPFTLQIMELPLERGQLTLIVGPSGGGKSTLLEGLAGELKLVGQDGNPIECPFTAFGYSVAYVPQSPFIMRGSVRANIKFHSLPSDDRYRQVVAACGLNEDFSQWADDGGDTKEAGEGGSNLSGGQRHRIALARALAADADIYLIDDFLGSLDQQVAAQVIANAIIPLLGRNKIVVCVSDNQKLIEVMSDPTKRTQVLRVEQGKMVLDVRTIQMPREREDVGPSNAAPRSKTTFTSKDGKCTFESEGSLADSTRTQPWVGDSTNVLPSSAMEQLRSASCSPDPREEISSSHTTSEASEEYLFGDELKCPQQTKHLDDDVTADAADEVVEKGTISLFAISIYFSGMGVPLFVGVIFSVFAMQAARNISEYYVASWADDHSNDNSSGDVPIFLQMLGYFACGNVVIAVVRSISFAYAGLRACQRIHDSTIEKLVSASYFHFFSHASTGQIINRISRDIYVIDDNLPFMLNVFVAQLFLLLGGVVIIAATSSPYVLIASIPVAVAVYFIQQPYRVANREIKRLEAAMRSPMVDSIGTILDGGTIIRPFGMLCVDHVIGVSTKNVMMWQRANYNLICLQWWFNLAMQLIGACVVLTVGISAVLSTWFGGGIASGAAGLALAYVNPLTGYISNLLGSFTELEKNFISVERVGEYLPLTNDAPPELVEETLDEGLVTRNPSFLPRSARSSTLNIPQLQSELSTCAVLLRNVSATYNQGRTFALSDISLRIQRGEKVAVVGRTGSGKSTLISLLCGMVPSTGVHGFRAMVGHNDLLRVNPDALRSEMSIVPQEVFLLEGSLLANLFPFTNLEHVHLPLFQYIAQMAIECIGIGHLNLEREVSNVSLSSGERHLVSIARVICLSLNLATEHDSKGRLTFVGNLLPVEMVDGGFNAVDGGRLEIKDLPRVSLRNETLIIDEPVAFLGAVAEGKMWTGLLSCFPDATVICVTHKLATLFKYFERIVVLEKGVVVATGSPAELKMRGILSK